MPHRSRVFKPYSGVFLQFMEIESLKLDFHVLNAQDASFQHCFETWQLTKFFYNYCYLARTIEGFASRTWGWRSDSLLEPILIQFLNSKIAYQFTSWANKD